MSLWRIAWRSIEQRGLASLLTALSMALGVMMVVAVLSIHGVVAESFRTNANLGYNLIVGAKGGKLQLTLNTVYYLDQPVENIPYDFYLEFCRAAQRDEELKNSLRYQSLAKQGASGEAAARAALGLGRDGKYAEFADFAIPVCLGDYFGPFRSVGTTPEFLERLTFGPANDRKYEFAAGRNFQHAPSQHGYFEAVVGARAARDLGVRLGDHLRATHGDPEGEGHGHPFTVVGILKPTGTPNDRVVLVHIEGFYLMEGHAKPVAERGQDTPHDKSEVAPAHHREAQHDHAQEHAVAGRLPLEQREVTAILVRTATPTATRILENQINEGPVGQAVLPVREIFNLLEFIVRPIQLLLLILTALICLVSGVSILVSIYNSMSDRRHDIAVMRALGASRATVMSVVLLESILIALGGGAIGWLGAHAVIGLAGPRIEARTGVPIAFWDLAPPIPDFELWGFAPIMRWLSPEILMIPALIVLAVLVGLLPAVAAYRTDVAKSLHE